MFSGATVAVVLVVIGAGLLFLAMGGEITGFAFPKPRPKWISLSAAFLGTVCLLGGGILGVSALLPNGPSSPAASTAPKQDAPDNAANGGAVQNTAGGTPRPEEEGTPPQPVTQPAPRPRLRNAPPPAPIRGGNINADNSSVAIQGNSNNVTYGSRRASDPDR